jgi:hypothetical protein
MLGKGQSVVFIAVMALILSQCQFQQLSRAADKSHGSHQPADSAESSVKTPIAEASKRTGDGLKFGEFRHKRVPPLGLGKVGAWIQPNSVDAALSYRFAQWFVADWRVIKQVSEKAGDKPVLIAFGAEYMGKVEDAEWQRIPKIRGVVLDYETGQTREQTERELIRIYRYLHGKGYLVGVSTLARPASSLKSNGVDFRRANLYCDFLLPQVYSRIWNNDPSETVKRYTEGLRESSVPVVPVIAYATTKKNPGRLTPDDVIRNYRPLELPSVVVWNVGKSDLKFWEAVDSL